MSDNTPAPRSSPTPSTPPKQGDPAANATGIPGTPLAPGVQKPGLKYEFKIAPADPKRNSIDFEDVADK